MNLAQRVVLSVALGAVLIVLGAAICLTFGDTVGTGAGWFMYQPSGNALLPVGGGSSEYVGQRAAVWLIAIAIWFVVSWRLFRSPRG